MKNWQKLILILGACFIVIAPTSYPAPIPLSYLNKTDSALTTATKVPNQAMIKAYIALGVGTATNLAGGNGTTLLGSVPYQSALNTTTLLAPNVAATQKFLAMTGSGVNGAAPGWVSVPAWPLAYTNLELANVPTAKATPLDADGMVYGDSNATWAYKSMTFTNLKAFLKTYFDGLYQPKQAIGTIASSATPHPSSNGAAGGTKVNHFTITSQTEALVLHAPEGTWADGDKLVVRIFDNDTAWGITYEANKYVSRISGVALPSTTVRLKYLYMEFIYNSTATRWDMVATSQE